MTAPRDAAARKVVLAAMAATLHGRRGDVPILWSGLSPAQREAVLVEAVAVAADLAARLAGKSGIGVTPVDADAELTVLGQSVRSALEARRGR